MLTNRDWLKPNKSFPPIPEVDRIQRYEDHLKYFNTEETTSLKTYSKRIARVINNYEEMISFPLIFNYQRLMSMKMADMVCGEHPIISSKSEKEVTTLDSIVNDIDFNGKIYSTVIDISRYGDAIWRLFIDDNGKRNFTVWDPRQWFPITRNDGTNTFSEHALCWIETAGDALDSEKFLCVQIHNVGYYDKYKFRMNSAQGVIGAQVGSTERVNTGLEVNAVWHIKAFGTSDTPYGHDDYAHIDSIVKELETRCAQISTILDKHADPSLTGPVTLLKKNPHTGENEFKPGKFYATANGDVAPEYLTWDGQLEASFKQIEVLLNQLYILSEMGAAIMGDKGADGQAVSAEAMRYKLVTPLNKARRVSNALTLASRNLLSAISAGGYEEIKTESISIEWRDGLPDDPRALMEYVKIASGENKVMPLAVAISRILRKTPSEAQSWINDIDERTRYLAEMDAEMSLDPADPEGEENNPGPNKGNSPTAKNGKVSNFKSPKN